jgi:hypothetical protein
MNKSTKRITDEIYYVGNVTQPLDKNTFFYYFLSETSGRHDPALLNEFIDKLKEWLPEQSNHCLEMNIVDAEYYCGQSDYRQFLMEKLK